MVGEVLPADDKAANIWARNLINVITLITLFPKIGTNWSVFSHR